MSSYVPAIILGAALAGAACSSNTPTPSTNDGSPVAAIERAATDAAPRQAGTPANACLIGYQTRYDALLPLDLAARTAGRPAGEAEVEYSKVTKNPEYQSVRYAWKSGRTRTISLGGMNISAPQDDAVELSGMKASSLEAFRQSHRAPTDSDQQQLNAEVDRSKEEALATDEGKALAKNIGGILMQVARAYRDVDGVGDAASFNTEESTLYVLDRGVQFSLLVSLSDDADANQAAAVSLAKTLMATCP